MKSLTKALMIAAVCCLPACAAKSEAPFVPQDSVYFLSQDKLIDINPQDSVYFLSQDKLIDINGMKVRYRDEGPRDGQALILVHGFTSSLESWDAVANDLKTDFRVIRLDLPGHGLTGPDPKARYSNEETVQFLEDYIRSIDVENPVLVGNSLGGLIAWRLAVKSPKFVSKLVLIAPGGFSINGVGDDPVAVPMMVKLYLTKAPEAGVKQATSALFSDPSKLSERRLNEIRDMMVVPGNSNAFVERAASFTLPDPTLDLTLVKVPSLLVWGQNDIMIPVTHAQKFATALPDVDLRIYENSGHVPQEEIPDILSKDIRNFLMEQE